MPTRRHTHSVGVSLLSHPIRWFALTCLLAAGCDKIQLPEVVQQAAPPAAPAAAPAAASAAVAPVVKAPADVPKSELNHKELVAAFYQKSKSFTLTDRDIIEAASTAPATTPIMAPAMTSSER